MIKLEFTEKEIEQLHHERLHHPHHRVRQKMEVVYLKALNYPHKEICRITRIAPNYSYPHCQGQKTVKIRFFSGER